MVGNNNNNNHNNDSEKNNNNDSNDYDTYNLRGQPGPIMHQDGLQSQAWKAPTVKVKNILVKNHLKIRMFGQKLLENENVLVKSHLKKR